MSKDNKNFDFQYRKRNLEEDVYFNSSFSSLYKSIKGVSSDDSFDTFKYGSTAISKILSYYGINHPDLLSDNEIMLNQLEYAFRPKGIMYKKVVLNKGWSKNVFAPMIMRLKSSKKYVALLPKAGLYYFEDNESKTTRIVTKKNENLFEDEAIYFYNSLPQESINVKSLYKFAFKSISVRDIVSMVIMALLIALIGLAGPYITKFLIGYVTQIQSISLLLSSVFFLVGITLSKVLFSLYKDLVFNKVLLKVTLAIDSATMMRILSLPVSFFREYSSGDVAKRFSYFSNACVALLAAVFDTGITALFSLVYLQQIAFIAPCLAAPALIVVLADLICSFISLYVRTVRLKKCMIIESKENGMVYSMIQGIQKIKVSGSEKRFISRWAYLFAQATALRYRPIYITILSTTFWFLGMLWIYIAAVNNNMAVDDYYAFTVAFANINIAVDNFIKAGNSIAQIPPALNLIYPILNAKPEVDEGKPIVRSLNGDIEIKNLSFRYKENQHKILDDFSMKVKAGDYVAIVGKTGCGKSTLVRLLLGFEQAESGSILYDGANIDSLDHRSLRRNLGIVMQDARVFAGSIAMNILQNVKEKTIEKAWEAATIASVAEDIKDMPMGMNTNIVEGSGGISGGQKQRILIARAVAPKPKILIFDEATSALDNITQKKVSESLDNLNCTRIVIAHRLSTIQNCDRVICIDKGKIVEQGSYDDLIKKDGFFANLVKRQQLNS